MTQASKPIKWLKRAAKDLRPGDCDRWGSGPGMENSYRTITHVEFVGRGLVRVRHRETIDTFYDEYGENYLIDVASETPTDVREIRRAERLAEENTQKPQSPHDER